ncbi:hypothetical protein AAW31_02600 [Nitrosomonas communis]|uniref:Uncharacterized protein n=1 Tax=Nitrosomonas communis TaxID=44574 RepID=A0A0F7KDU7_9PROT|nr:hypothetical protein AAW31_02600 [Nitrosomonas communis]
MILPPNIGKINTLFNKNRIHYVGSIAKYFSSGPFLPFTQKAPKEYISALLECAEKARINMLLQHMTNSKETFLLNNQVL